MKIRQKKIAPRIPPFKVLEVTGIDMDQSYTCDFLLVISQAAPYRCTVQSQWETANFDPQ